MANICLYKIKVVGRKRACYALIDMMPLYSGDKDIVFEDGTDEEYSLIFTGDCKWHVDAYTQALTNPQPFTPEELDAVSDGQYWQVPILQKSILLDCDIMCNSKDIDAGGKAYYEHYNRGVVINDECPKEIHIKRGREYDYGFVEIEREHIAGTECKVKFEKGAYMYRGDFEVGDIVKVEGAKAGALGRVIKAVKTEDCNMTLYEITEKVGYATPFKEKDIEKIWDSFKPADRKLWLVAMGLDEKTTKKKFLSVMDYKWTEFALTENDWEKFLNSIKG